jgi:sugar O-acyltransferase (sialic acid O-acetyltransferase NeuD family)
MLIVGARGLAKELLEVCKNSDDLQNLAFYDNINKDVDLLYNEFPILHDDKAVSKYFETSDKRFVLGFGSLKYRISFSEKFINLGGKLTSVISDNALISSYDVKISNGTTIMPGAIISNGVSIGVGCLVYFNVLITHDVTIGDFNIISPGVKILGRVKIGERCNIGANATILPDVIIGNDVIIGAGAVVTKDVLDGLKVVGIPAKVI